MLNNPVFFEKLVSIRRDFHQHPELSWHEEETAKRVCGYLDQLGVSYRPGIAKHGILAEIPGKEKGPYIALRADMDALPITEETGLEFTSLNKGVMHACGHDGHMTILLGAAEILLQEVPLPLPVRLVFQPAEEASRGALSMIEDGALENVKVIFGGHLDLNFHTGSIVVTDGAVSASTDQFQIEISGQGAHGAKPHEGTDVIVIASSIVIAIQTLVSREVDPALPCVVTVGELKAGTAHNVIAGKALLRGTIRAQHPDVRNHLAEGVERIANSICALHGAEANVDIKRGSPPLINSESLTAIAREAATEVVSAERVDRLRTAYMVGEDFSQYLEHVPGCYVRYGAQVLGVETFPAHSSRYDFDEKALPMGSGYLATVAKIAAHKVIEGSL